MLQAEIGSARVMDKNSIPSRGHVLRDFTLSATNGKRVSLYDYRAHANLAVILAGGCDMGVERTFLSTLVERYAEIRSQDAEVLLLLGCPLASSKNIEEHAAVPFPVLLDEDAEVHRSLKSHGAQNSLTESVYVTDRFLEVHAVWSVARGDTLPNVSELISWLEYINSLCPECTQLEWPQDN